MECRASFGEVFVEVEVGDYGCNRDVAVAESEPEWIAGGCRWSLLGWSRWAEVALQEGVGAGAAESGAAALGVLLVPVAEEVLYVVAQAEAQVPLSALLAAGFASVAGFVVVVVAKTFNNVCQTSNILRHTKSPTSIRLI